MEDCADWGDEITALVDEHYYEPPSFFFTNTHRYDSYDRDSQAKVFLGEYAAQSNTQPSEAAASTVSSVGRLTVPLLFAKSCCT